MPVLTALRTQAMIPNEDLSRILPATNVTRPKMYGTGYLHKSAGDSSRFTGENFPSFLPALKSGTIGYGRPQYCHIVFVCFPPACLTIRYSLSIIDLSPSSAQAIGFQCTLPESQCLVPHVISELFLFFLNFFPIMLEKWKLRRYYRQL